MRKERFLWATLVAGILFTAYGISLLFYHLNRGRGFSAIYVVFIVIGVLILAMHLALFIFKKKQEKANKQKEEMVIEPVKEEEKQEIKEEIIATKEEQKEEVVEEKKSPAPKIRDDTEYVRTRISYVSRYDNDDETIYINKSGYGPVLRVTGRQILDMRNNTYYFIEANSVNRQGSGPVYEISGNRIREAYGSYLFEISGNNINKTYGGFFASISGNTITTYDLSERYEMSGSLSSKKLLAVSAILFGRY